MKQLLMAINSLLKIRELDNDLTFGYAVNFWKDNLITSCRLLCDTAGRYEIFQSTVAVEP